VIERATLLVNPFASGVTEKSLAAVELELGRRVELSVSLTQERGHATELARSVRDVDVLLIYGGDGLLNEVLNGSDGQLPVGVLPGGRTNVFARAIGVPRDPVEAARRVLDARAQRISLGRANGRRFSFAGGIGFDAELIRRIDALGHRGDGRRPGDLRFTWEAARLLGGRRGRYEPVLEIEGFGRAALVFVANGDPYSYVGARPLRVAPEARFELGLDLVAPTRLSPGSIPRLLAYAARGRGQAGAEDILYGHDLDRIAVRADRPLPLQVDGEDLGDVAEAVFEAERDAVSVLFPRQTG
jgi:diacylglycerol kinase family enzyme